MSWRATVAAMSAALLGAVAVPGTGSAADAIAGIPASGVGEHGPTANHLAGLELVAHSPIKPSDELARHGLGNNGAPALISSSASGAPALCAFVGRWHDYTNKRGVQIVDVDPGSASYLSVLGRIEETAVTGATSREVRGVDLDGFRMLAVLTFSDNAANRPDRQLNTLRLFDFPSGDCRQPRFTGQYDMLASRPHEFFLWLDPDPAHDVNGHPRVLAYITLPLGGSNVHVADVSDPALPRLVATYDAGIPILSPEEPGGTFLGNYAHSISLAPDGRRAFMSYWDAGVFTVDTSALAEGLPAGAILPLGRASEPLDYSPPDVGNTHSAVLARDVQSGGSDVAVVGDEVYGGIDGCPYGWMRTVAVGSATQPPSQLGEMRLAENRSENCDTTTRLLTLRNSKGLAVDGTFSMHNQTTLGRWVLTTWYGGGMRVVDVADPSAPVEVGAFVPAPLPTVRTASDAVGPAQRRTSSPEDDWWVETWSYPIVRDGLIYVTDIRSGLYILRPAPGAPFAATVAGTSFAEGNSNAGDLS